MIGTEDDGTNNIHYCIVQKIAHAFFILNVNTCTCMVVNRKKKLSTQVDTSKWVVFILVFGFKVPLK